jgi:outer membrane protease
MSHCSKGNGMRNFKRGVVLAAIVASCAGADRAHAGDLGEQSLKDVPVLRASSFALDASLGLRKGKANEYVYDTEGVKRSQLIWKYDNNAMLNAGATWAPLTWLTLGAKGNINLSQSGVMDDWDWNSQQPAAVRTPTSACELIEVCHSHHDDTKLKRDTSVDLSAAGTVFRNNGISISGIAGYKWSYSKWQAFNGTANYDPYVFDGLGITYEQWWEAPYIGLQAKAEFGKWSFGGKVIGSWWASAHDQDYHHFRDVLYTDDFRKSDMIGATAEAGYKLTDTLTMSVTYDYLRWCQARGPATMTYYGLRDAGSRDSFGGAIPSVADGGADSTTHTISLGLNYKF